MNTEPTKEIQEIAQWVIDNRYPKSEHEKTTDFELYKDFICGNCGKGFNSLDALWWHKGGCKE